MTSAGRSHFFCDVCKLKFSFYWTKNLHRYKEISKSLLSIKSRQIVVMLEHLPKNIPTQKIVHCYLSPKLANDIHNEFIFFYDLCNLANLKILYFCRLHGSTFSKVSADEDEFVKPSRKMAEVAQKEV